MADPTINRHGDRIEIGGDLVRVERGPAMRTGTASAALLANDKTAEHYSVGAPDALGKPIEDGKKFSYLDYLADPVFYVFERVQIDASDPRFERFAPVNDPAAQMLPDDSTNVQVYAYVYEDRGNFPTEEEAVAEGQRIAAAATKG